MDFTENKSNLCESLIKTVFSSGQKNSSYKRKSKINFKDYKYIQFKGNIYNQKFLTSALT